ncbi:Unknown protein [Striga hermonthica]|uniref:Uncharacterized protein n=1 Tax=Striga hermonthica TaxID=68872 RepID=A0A9N7NTE8_STRHE|nr:Unknown protein [Striga hermonthica]
MYLAPLSKILTLRSLPLDLSFSVTTLHHQPLTIHRHHHPIFHHHHLLPCSPRHQSPQSPFSSVKLFPTILCHAANCSASPAHAWCRFQQKRTRKPLQPPTFSAPSASLLDVSAPTKSPAPSSFESCTRCQRRSSAIICPHKPTSRAAVKATCRVLAVVFLSLLLPLSVLLLARLSIARYLLSISGDKTTWVLNLLVFLVAFSALVNCLTGSNPVLLIGERRRICAAWALIFLMQACLSLGIRGTIDAEINSSAEGNNWVLLKLTDPPVAADLAMNGWAAAGVAGWWLYYLTAAVGVVRAVRDRRSDVEAGVLREQSMLSIYIFDHVFL